MPDKKQNDVLATIAILAVTAALLMAPVAGIVLMALLSGNDGNGDDVPSGTGDGSLQASTRERWVKYLNSAPVEEEPLDGPKTTWDEEKALQEASDIDVSFDPDNASYSSNPSPSNGAGQETGAEGDRNNALDDAAAKSSGDGKPREVEESDIIKTVSDKMFILNPYLGLIVVDISDPSSPEIVGRLGVRGSPVSMYIVDFLAFVIVVLPSNTPYIESSYSPPQGALYIISIMDPKDPIIAKSVPISGYPLDSRRVGEVIYVVSNLYGYYNVPMGGIRGSMGMEDDVKGEPAVSEENVSSDPADYRTDRTEIVSISFSDPESIGEKDRLSSPGTSSNICVSEKAIFMSSYDYQGETPRTGITYVDISDPEGDISVRGSISVKGWLADRYQMDYYDGYFRMVTQLWGEDLAESTLYVISCSDPDALRIVGDLQIDDAGSLMATRFAGERGYTIHLPRSIDPLDVLDLSDPEDPKLCDMLEMPGWVEHMEVVGYDIIAIGVDDSSGTWQVALSLFDVTDPYDAVMKDRVVMGEGWSYSPANYDPKALTIDAQSGMVLVPFYSYDPYSYMGINRIQIVTVDLEAGDLSLRGEISTDSAATRTRVVGGWILATSEMELVSADVSDPDRPVIDAILPLTSQYSDAHSVGGRIVACVSPTWGNDAALIRVIDPSDPFHPISETGVEGLRYQDIRMSGDTVYIKGLRITKDSVNWELHSFDVSDPNNINEVGTASIAITDMFVWIRDIPGGTDLNGTEKGSSSRPSGTDDEGMFAVYYDPMQYTALSDGTIVVWTYAGYYSYDMMAYKEQSLKAWIVDMSSDGGVSRMDLGSWYYIDKVLGSRDEIVLSTVMWDYATHYGYSTQGSALKLLVRDGSTYDITDVTVQGSLIGASSDLSFIYTIYSWYDPQSGSSGNALLTYEVKGTDVELADSAAVDGYYSSMVYMDDDVLVLMEGGYWYGYYGGYGMEMDGSGSAQKSEGGVSADSRTDDKGVPEPYVPTTKLFVIRLSDGVPKSIRSVSIEGYYYKVNVEGGLFLQGNGIVTGFSVDSGVLTPVGPWEINGWVAGGEYRSGSGVLALGLWGLKQIE